MPYITQKDRNFLKGALDGLEGHIDCTTKVGEMNYLITSLIHEWIKENGGIGYDNINAMNGVLGCVGLELYRQLAAGYEDQKKSENGPVSELDA